ncbi:MAG TPA: SDR family oxidoreductase [Phycisphaerales bacterium]|nr:SDR family oxidoreductase [Phycisphaerales bacterium]
MNPRPLAVVTGAGKRVGRAIAIELAHAGFDLALTYRHSEHEIHETANLAQHAAVERAGTFTIDLHKADFENDDDVNRLGLALASKPRIDAIVHNASVYERSPFNTLSNDEMLRHYQVNAIVPALLTRSASRLLAESPLPGGGAVVCMSDMHLQGRPQKDFLAYAMSKAALDNMVQNLARELAPRIRVNAIAPGVLCWPDDTPADVRKTYEARIPLGRAGTPADAANMVRWLILEAQYVTGETIRLDGGRWLM